MGPLEFSREGDGVRIGIHVGHLPGRKSPCVAIVRGSVIKVVGYLRSDDDMLELQQAMSELLGVPLPAPEATP